MIVTYINFFNLDHVIVLALYLLPPIANINHFGIFWKSEISQ